MAKIKQNIEDFVIDYRLADDRGPTPERQRHGDSPINQALAKEQISPLQYAAAQKFYAHWFHGWRASSVPSVNLLGVFSAFSPTDKMPRNEWQAFHRRNYDQAIKALEATRNWKYTFVIPKIVLEERKINEVSYMVGDKILWKNRPQAFAVTMEALRDGLDILGRQFGIIA